MLIPDQTFSKCIWATVPPFLLLWFPGYPWEPIIFQKINHLGDSRLFSKSNQGSALLSGNISEDILKHNFKTSEIQVPVIFGYNILGPISLFGGPSFKYNLKTSSDIFDLEDIKDKYKLSLLLGSRIKIKSIGIDLRYERGLNSGEIKIINANGLNIPNGNIDSTNNRFSILISYDLPNGIFSKKKWALVVRV